MAARTASKTANKTAPKARNSNKNPTPKRAIDDNYVAPKRKPKPEAEIKTFAEVLAEAGQTIEDIKAESEALQAEEAPAEDEIHGDKSNLALTVRKYRDKYQKAVAPSGRKTQNNGDAVARALLRLSLEQVKAFCQAKMTGLEYDRLNPGHQRMCYGNRIRAWYKAGEQDVVELVTRLTAEADADSSDEPTDA